MTQLIVLSCLALILSTAIVTAGRAWQAVQEPGLQAFNQSLRVGRPAKFCGRHSSPAGKRDGKHAAQMKSA